MNKKLLDILVCPFDKVSSLELFQFKAKANPNSLATIADNEESDSQKTLTNEEQNDQKTREPSTSANSASILEINKEPSETVEEGLLLCRTCLRFYPITEEIPIILPDELRDKKKDIEFLKTWNGSIPIDLLKNLKPWTI
jgi:uncharacterized protein YbaR (Trm112 family)